MEKSDNKEKVSWNLAEALIEELGDLLKQASRNYVQNNFDKVFSILKAIRMRIVDRLTDEELKMFIDMEDNLYILSNKKKQTGDFGKPNKETIESGYKFWKTLDNYNNTLLKTMRKYGYLIGAKQDKTQLSI